MRQPEQAPHPHRHGGQLVMAAAHRGHRARQTAIRDGWLDTQIGGSRLSDTHPVGGKGHADLQWSGDAPGQDVGDGPGDLRNVSHHPGIDREGDHDRHCQDHHQPDGQEEAGERHCSERQGGAQRGRHDYRGTGVAASAALTASEARYSSICASGRMTSRWVST